MAIDDKDKATTTKNDKDKDNNKDKDNTKMAVDDKPSDDTKICPIPDTKNNNNNNNNEQKDKSKKKKKVTIDDDEKKHEPKEEKKKVVEEPKFEVLSNPARVTWTQHRVLSLEPNQRYVPVKKVIF